MVYYFLIEKTIFEQTIFAFNTVNDYTLQKSDFNQDFEKDGKTYVACACDEAYISDSLFVKILPENLQSCLSSDVTLITPRQLDLQLLEENIYDKMQEIVKTSIEAKIWYTRSLNFERDHPMLLQFAQLLGKDYKYIVNFFNKASKK